MSGLWCSSRSRLLACGVVHSGSLHTPQSRGRNAEPCWEKHITEGRLLEYIAHSTSSLLCLLSVCGLRYDLSASIACCHASQSIRDSSSGTVSKNKLVPRSRSWPWCLLQQQKAPNMFWSLWKSTSSFGEQEVQDNVFRVATALLGTHLTILPPPVSQRLYWSKGSLPQCLSVLFLQRLQHYYTLPGHSDSQNQRVHNPSPWESRFQS